MTDWEAILILREVQEVREFYEDDPDEVMLHLPLELIERFVDLLEEDDDL